MKFLSGGNNLLTIFKISSIRAIGSTNLLIDRLYCCRPFNIFWIHKYFCSLRNLHLSGDHHTISEHQANDFLLVETILSLLPSNLILNFPLPLNNIMLQLIF